MNNIPYRKSLATLILWKCLTSASFFFKKVFCLLLSINWTKRWCLWALSLKKDFHDVSNFNLKFCTGKNNGINFPYIKNLAVLFLKNVWPVSRSFLKTFFLFLRSIKLTNRCFLWDFIFIKWVSRRFTDYWILNRFEQEIQIAFIYSACNCEFFSVPKQKK